MSNLLNKEAWWVWVIVLILVVSIVGICLSPMLLFVKIFISVVLGLILLVFLFIVSAIHGPQ